MRNILFVSYASPLTPTSGFAYRALAILRWLLARYRVSLAFAGTEHDLGESRIALERFASVTLLGVPPAAERFRGITMGRLPYHHARYSGGATRQALADVLGAHVIDLIWLNKTVHVPALMGLPGLPPVVVDQIAAESVVWDNLIRNDPRWWAKPFFRWNRERVLRFERRAYSHLAGVVCITPEEYELTQQEHPGIPTLLVPQGVDPDYYRPDPTALPDPDTLLFSGTGAVRNVEAMRFFLREIMPQLAAQHDSMRVLWIGNVDARRHAFLRHPAVSCTGFVLDTPPHFDRGMIFVSPFTMGEGMKTKVVEALAMGKVVVGTPVGLAGMDSRGLAFIRCCETPREFGEAVLAFRHDPDLPALCAAARSWVLDRYAWEPVLAPLEPFLDGAMAGPQPLPG